MLQFEVLFTGLVSIIVSVIAGYFAWRAARDSRQVNDAVNHRHEKRGDGALKLYDLSWENHQKIDELVEWKRGYEGAGLLDTGKKVVEYTDHINTRLDTLEELTKAAKCPNKES